MSGEATTEAGHAESQPRKSAGFPKRYVLVIMVFLGLGMQYALRVNINVAITAMCNNHTVKENGFTKNKVRHACTINKTPPLLLCHFIPPSVASYMHKNGSW